MLHKHYTLKLRVSFSQRKALHRPPLCDTRLQAKDYNCAFFCCHSPFSKRSLALMKESRSLGTEKISVDVFCLQKITDWKSHFRRNVFGNSKVEAQILPSPSCPHTLRPDIIIRQTTAGLYMQDTRAKKPRHLIWAMLLYRKSVCLTLSVGVWGFCLLDRSLARRERQRRKISIHRRKRRFGFHVYSRSPCDTSLCRVLWVHADGEGLQLDVCSEMSPGKASPRTARGISTIINNPVFGRGRASTFFKKSCLCGALQEAPSNLSSIIKGAREGFIANNEDFCFSTSFSTDGRGGDYPESIFTTGVYTKDDNFLWPFWPVELQQCTLGQGLNVIQRHIYIFLGWESQSKAPFVQD